jgi:4-hydroxybenzoate polyprenyltransferase
MFIAGFMMENKVRECLAIGRLKRTQTTVASFIFGAFLASRQLFVSSEIFLGILSYLGIYGFASVVNDIADFDFDEENALKTSSFKKDELWMISILYLLLGLFFASINQLLLYSIFGSIFAGIIYSFGPKIKNCRFNTFFLGLTHFIMPTITSYLMFSMNINLEMLVFILSIYLWIVGVIFVKDVKDYARDREEGRVNFVQIYGIKTTTKVSLIFSTIFTLSSLYYINKFSVNSILSILLIGSVLFTTFHISKLLHSQDENIGYNVLKKIRTSVASNIFLWTLAVAV